METFNAPLPLALYIHLPWCVKKCPYCDFNSHAQKGELPEEAYIDALLEDFEQHLPGIKGRSLCSIFIGGGTPSLFSAKSLDRLLSSIKAKLPFEKDVEITLEANPGTAEQARFSAYRKIGINRLSIGVQSFNDAQLKKLGRIHDANTAKAAIQCARTAGFDNFNIDLMFALPEQTQAEALRDIQTALSFSPTHLSWYQLTIEPNTLFHHSPPPLPNDDDSFEIQTAGHALLAENGFEQYEVSAFSQQDKRCRHNVNYWEFGDYLGIGAGAHSKITHANDGNIVRHWNVKNPKDYLNKSKPFIANNRVLSESDLPFEFMLNVLRLKDGVPTSYFNERTGLSLDSIHDLIQTAEHKKLLAKDNTCIKPTALGERFLNNLTGLFLQ